MKPSGDSLHGYAFPIGLADQRPLRIGDPPLGAFGGRDRFGNPEIADPVPAPQCSNGGPGPVVGKKLRGHGRTFPLTALSADRAYAVLISRGKRLPGRAHTTYADPQAGGNRRRLTAVEQGGKYAFAAPARGTGPETAAAAAAVAPGQHPAIRMPLAERLTAGIARSAVLMGRQSSHGRIEDLGQRTRMRSCRNMFLKLGGAAAMDAEAAITPFVRDVGNLQPPVAQACTLEASRATDFRAALSAGVEPDADAARREQAPQEPGRRMRPATKTEAVAIVPLGALVRRQQSHLCGAQTVGARPPGTHWPAGMTSDVERMRTAFVMTAARLRSAFE